MRIHCGLHTESISPILDLVGIENYGITAPRGDPGERYVFVGIPQIGFVVGNGEIDDRDTIPE